MLSKNKIDRKLKEYIKGHLSKGYSKRAVRHVLVCHGYNEPYVDGLLRKHSEIQFVKKYAIIASLVFIISMLSFNILPSEGQQKMTGYIISISSSNEGCCMPLCEQVPRNECYGIFIEDKECSEVKGCDIGYYTYKERI